MGRLSALVICLVLGCNISARAQSSGNDNLRGCEDVVASMQGRGSTHLDVIYRNGLCSGAVGSLMQIGLLLPAPQFRFCAPDNATNGQAVRVVTAYLEAHPESLNQEFTWLAIAAMRNAWPCQQ